MIEIARVLGLTAAAMMVIAFAIWTNWLRGPLLQRLDGKRASNAAPAALAIRLLAAAFIASSVAAALAMIGRIWS